jgi:LacI family transcriptional regulator
MDQRCFSPRIVTVHEQDAARCGELADRLMESGNPLSVLSNWSRGAAALYRAAYRYKREIGHDLRIMSADNTFQVNEYLVPSLSSVDVPYQAMGAAAATRLIEYVDGSRPLADTSNIWLPAELCIRESC